jgi:pimeloyl-ACP methyl ester carboxylesterase
MPLITTTTGELFVMRRGSSGLPLIFIHGAGGSSRHWGRLLALLPPTIQVIAVDLPGHGRSPACEQISIADYAMHVVSLHQALGLPPALIVGHSMGGAIALQIALTAPHMVAGLGLVSTAARLRVAPALLNGLAGDSPARHEAISTLVNWLFGPTVNSDLITDALTEYTALDPAILLADFRACDGFDLRSRLGEIRCPALVITGTEDRLTPPKLGAELAAGLGVAHHLMANVGHMPMLEAPDRLCDQLSHLLLACNK